MCQRSHGRCRAPPHNPLPPLKGLAASHGKGPGPGRSRPGTFSRQQPSSPGETSGPPEDPTRSQLQGTGPGKGDLFPGTPSPAFTPVPPPPSPSPAVRLRALAPALWAGSALGPPHGPSPPMTGRGLEVATPPCPALSRERGTLAWRMRLLSQPAVDSACWAACCVRTRAVWFNRGPRAFEAAEPVSFSGKAGQAWACAQASMWAGGRPGLPSLPFCPSQRAIGKSCSKFSPFTAKRESGEPSLPPRGPHPRAVAARAAVGARSPASQPKWQGADMWRTRGPLARALLPRLGGGARGGLGDTRLSRQRHPRRACCASSSRMVLRRKGRAVTRLRCHVQSPKWAPWLCAFECREPLDEATRPWGGGSSWSLWETLPGRVRTASDATGVPEAGLSRTWGPRLSRWAAAGGCVWRECLPWTAAWVDTWV